MTAPAFAKGHRGALLIGTGNYDHPDLAPLLSPAVDCARLAEVLHDKEIGAFDVQQLVDADLSLLMRAIEEFFGQAQRDDVRLLYLSCHGIVNWRNDKLHFAVRTTDPDWPAHSSLSASFIHDQMEACRARSIVVVLDCCYSGRFLPGAKGVDSPAEFEKALVGHGRVVITAGTRTQRAYEGEHPDPAAPMPSRFTGPLVDGLRTGAADLNGDGIITVRELYEYVCQRLHAEGVEQNPLMGYELHNDIALARVKAKPKKRRPRRVPRPTAPSRRPDLPWRVPVASGPAHQPVFLDSLLIVHQKYDLHVIDVGIRRRLRLIQLKHPGRPAFHDGMAYFPGRDNRLQAVDLRTGRPRRCRQLMVSDGVLAISGGVLYAPSLDGHLYTVDLATGDDHRPRLPLRGLTVTRPPEAAGKIVVLMARNGADHVIAVDLATGSPNWSYEAGQPLSGQWIVTDQNVHFVEQVEGIPGRITTLDLVTGKTLWSYEFPAGLAAAPAAANGLVFAGDMDNRLLALDANTGDKRWGRKTEGRLLTRPAPVDNTLYTADRAARLTAWRFTDGRKLRSHELLLSQDTQGSPAYADGAVYVTDSQGYLHALSAC
ncbi:PQQ-binding-like beta-propeller repeat protein [Streptomyces echinoruber]|uniref:Pyrrolo-quinoline quinone repeat domain-containing protein n=1 Tax=Streptomyces echinoruber TaxID=68898 RepID=A0A918RBT2_9ACTN|nr:PQQ-binding-like beta-propeller repeat protein [Streptomyces echinoruber]GGZ94218.1 hypothetical protein GCM10010389_36200 [Streptomyces echinoruber]